MSYALVGSLGTANLGGAGSATTPTYGQSPTAGNLLILWVSGHAIASVTSANMIPATPSGWSQAVEVDFENASQAASSTVFYKIAAGGDGTPTISAVTNVRWVAMLGEFSGNAPATPTDQTATAGSNAANTSPTVVTAGAADVASGDLVIACAAMAMPGNTSGSANVWTPNNGASFTDSNNNAAGSVRYHYNYAYGVTTGISAANSSSFAHIVNPTAALSIVQVSFRTSTPFVGASPSATTTVAATVSSKTPVAASLGATASASATVTRPGSAVFAGAMGATATVAATVAIGPVTAQPFTFMLVRQTMI